jgi:hypothetical protein
MVIGITKFSLLITFYLDWGFTSASLNIWSLNQSMASDSQHQILVKKISPYQLYGGHQYLMEYL